MATAVATAPGGGGKVRRPPGRAKRLSPADRKLYDSIPDVVDYVPHPDYRLVRTEQDLFGPQAEDVPVLKWHQFPEIEDQGAAPHKPRPKLSRRQECLLFMRYNYAKYRLAGLMSAQSRRPRSSRLDDILLWYRRVLEARAVLTHANMALVVAMIKRTRISTVEFGDLVSEGNMALLRAIDKFDPGRGFKFSTYACRAILKALGRLAKRSGTYRQHFPTEFDPDLERSDEDERRRRDERDLAIEDLRRALARNAAELTEVEHAVVCARFAVAGQREVKTLQEVGQMVGLSKERVRQVQIGALAKLRAALGGAAA